ncbi:MULTISPECIES: ABC transporter permease [unclassified Psychrobacter]|uniref:ABC transporter permease n=1 Tax=unclassified Psychrobacter TaxID=196806 RepID=UPI000AD922E8|nr:MULTISPECIES: FtsX-like permease family protein [unclassified Psychrobacter]MBA6243453.1 FtsX-like permease family protein [Psychrobacter sp. Urea-trap-18]MBA6286070.1 FtsX-like permease family protein [Psychrobacter sp. Urea-trap-16]MBA6318233.1 FtsX-like permease family protein [Psychrobacter sp. Urea-trap-20]MBA6333723.1 FtsX-like permease family protein [Psychrobacter sp. Urea-trap-19]PKG61241.1 ABC transporter substrate-binding protein [Psychrobacter sp. Choline-3u-12]
MNSKPTDNKLPDTKKTATSMHQESSYPSGILSQLFTRTLGFQTLGSQALSRSWWQRWVYPVLFLMTLTLSLATYLTLDSVQQSVDSYINDNQRALVGGDLILNSKQDWPSEVLSQVETIPNTQIVYDYQFSAMLVNDEQTLLASVKAVSPSYPLYGTAELASGQPLWDQLTSDSVIVAPEVLSSLQADVGDRITIGDAQFTISDVLTKEPDRPLTTFGFGGRVLMKQDALEATNLLGQRSRINYRIEMAGDPELITTQREQLTEILTNYPDIELSDAESADTSVSRISDNVLMFLKLLVIAVLLLSAVAMYGVISAFVSKQQSNNAIRLALGEPLGSLKRSYYQLLIITTVIACIAAVALSLGLLKIGQPYMVAILPADVGLAINPISAIKTIVIALVLTLLIAQRGLSTLSTTKPATLLSQGASTQTQNLPWYRRVPLLWYGLVLAGLYAFFAYEVGSLSLGAQLLGGLIGFVAIFWLLARGWLWLLNKLASNTKVSWMQRIAIHNLARKGNQSALFFVTLSLSVAVLTLITTLNHSINAQFINAYPEDAPNLFLLDVQSDQHDDIDAIIEAPVTYYPVIRARVETANDVAAKDIEPADGFDDPTRVFNLSYADTVMETEYITESLTDDALYSSIDATNEQIKPLSILDTAAGMLNVGMGDQVRFNIQGIEIIGQITSIRTRYERGPSPYFYFLFEPSVLSAAPQIQFATAHVSESAIPELQGKLVRKFPAVTTIDGTAIAKQIQELVVQMSRLVYVFTLLALLTGVMVLISSLLSTSQDRMKDSASFRLLGMQKRDLYMLNILELGVLGISAATFAVVIASVGAWAAITQWFNLQFSVPWLSLAIGGAALIVLLFAIAIIYVRLVIGRGIMARVRAMI